jgi:hypothetical protein
MPPSSAPEDAQFTPAQIAGHSSITVTQRYVHAQADTIERAFLQAHQAAMPEAAQPKD